MMHKRFWFLLPLVACFLALAGARPTQAQEPVYPPLGEYILFWRLADDALAGCQTLPESRSQTLSLRSETWPPLSAAGCGTCSRLPDAFTTDRPGCRSANARPPERLWAVLLDLQARRQIEILERLPDQRALRLLADADAATWLSSHPETARLRLIKPISALPGEEESRTAPTPWPMEKSPEPAGPPPAKPMPSAEMLAKPVPTERAPLTELTLTGPLDEIVVYTWVDNQGPDPPITYNWVEISDTGTVVAQGDDTYTEVELGFPFAFYGTTYTHAYVSSNGFVSFGSGSSRASNTSIPNPNSPNNATYAFWDDLEPTGGDNGNVYVQQVDATTFVIEWYQVKRDFSSDYETFQIILNGADDIILLQYQGVSNTGYCTVGVENADGTLATQYAYNTSGAVSDELAILFTPVSMPAYTIEGTVRDYDGAPVSWAKVEVVAGPMLAYDHTEANGTYSLSVIAGIYTLWAEKYGYFTTPERTVTVPPDQTDVDLAFPERYTISGTVYDYDGTPLQGVWVRTDSGPVYDSDSTDANGEYILTVISGTYTIEASKSGYF
ncbi:MAG: carboxypeptidase regulatory-like domain-containing protein, partial [Anaerolineae bacterium]